MRVSKRIRVLLDTNVWRYWSDHCDAQTLVREAGRAGAQIQVAPVIVNEVLRLPEHQAALRRTLLVLLTNESWSRLLPEVYWESLEFLEEVGRKRPEWLRLSPDRKSHDDQFRDWTSSRGFWFRARFRIPAEAAALREREAGALDAARDEAADLRGSIQNSRMATFDPSKRVMARLSGPKGRRWGPIEMWRAEGREWMARQLTSRSPHGEWIGSFLAQDRVDDESWDQFWYAEVDPRAMPRWWIRSVLRILQGTRRTSSGTPCDNQLAMHLPESDLFITADKTFADQVGAIGKASPTRVAGVAQISAGAEAVPATLEAIREHAVKAAARADDADESR